MRSMRGPVRGRVLRLAVLACGLALAAFPQKKKDETQVLQTPRDLPSTVEGDPRRLSFYVTPLSDKGNLSKQVRDALSALTRESKGDPILKIRAFVAGSGDGRRVRDIVSEIFTDRKQPLPVLSLVQAGSLPEQAQVVLEAVAESRKQANPHGLAFVAAQPASGDDPSAPAAPLAGKSLSSLRAALQAAGAQAVDVLRVSCFLSTLDDVGAVRKLVEQEYPKIPANFVQTQRSPARSMAACEAVARLKSDSPPGLRTIVLDGQPQVALVAAPRVVLTGTQVSFGFEEKDARLALQRVQKSLEQAGTSMQQVAFAHFYPLATGIATQIVKIRGDFFDAAHPPVVSALLFEGLPSMNAGFALDVVAVK
jgi:enamine deaminase RidA (YjgF/YER057c/UK114 family)